MDTPSNDNDVGATDGHPELPRAKNRTWIAASLLGAALVVCLLPVALASTPRQCGSCHEMKPYYDSWQASSHRGAVSNCVTCHAKPGVLGLVAFEAGLYPMFLAHVAGAKVSTTTANMPSVESCRRSGCHSLNREVSNSGDIKINHRLHVTTENIACPTCHPGAVHAGVGSRLKLPPMKLCKQCHADKMSDCSYCHTSQHLQAPPGAH